jgi:hypothetical protein
VVVEAALVTPLLLVLLLGIIEMSLLMRDVVATSSSVRVGARMASTAAGAGQGTCQASGPTPPPCTPAQAPKVAQLAADAIQRAGSAMPKDQIEWILVYQANDKGYPMPNGNTSLSCSLSCVKYVWDSGLSTPAFRYSSGSWDSKSINACVNDAGLMAVGVAMHAHHPWVSGFFGDGVELEERTVMQFEPLPNESCKSTSVNPHP